MKIAVIGAGIFGISIALRLNRAGYKVDLIERYGDILQAASGSNQYRLHRGYHYPRSFETSNSAKFAESYFRSEYPEAVIDTNNHYYGLAKEGSKVNASQFKDFCRRCGLEFENVSLPLLNEKEFQLIVKVKESLFDPHILYRICKDKLNNSSVNLIFNKTADSRILDSYDVVVNCTYANLNSVLDEKKHPKKKYQFELCEKPVMKFPSAFNKTSIVVIDGPFMCIDPLGSTGLHVVGNVVHALHVTDVNEVFEIPNKYLDIINKGVISIEKIRDLTNIEKFIHSSARFIPEITKVEHVGSMFTVRTVLPNLDHSDARPTLVEELSDKLINVFSGKIGNSVIAAEKVLELINKKLKKVD